MTPEEAITKIYWLVWKYDEKDSDELRKMAYEIQYLAWAAMRTDET